MPSRISNAQIFQNSQNHIANARAKEAESLEKSGSGKDLIRPSQNPGAWAEMANLKDDQSIRDTIVGNVNVAVRTMTATEHVLGSIMESCQRMYEIAITCAGTDGSSEMSRTATLSEAKQVYNHLIQVLNTKYANRALFSGTKTDSHAFDSEGKYLGNQDTWEIELERGHKLQVNVPTGKTILGEGEPPGVNIIENFRTLLEGLQTNDAKKVFSTIGNLQKAGDQISTARAELAGRVNRMESALNLHSEKRLETIDNVSKIEDADSVKVFSELARDQATLQAALSTTKKVLDETPVDILYR